jgi:hypothetical protein
MSCQIFAIAGHFDPVPWITGTEDTAFILSELSNQFYWVDMSRRVSIFNSGSRVTRDYYAVCGGLVDENLYAQSKITKEDLQPFGWLPDFLVYIIQSLHTEMRLLFQLLNLNPPPEVHSTLLENAFYIVRLRHDILSCIPDGNRSQSPPTVPMQPPHSFVCWMARCAHRLEHDDKSRTLWMLDNQNESLTSYVRVATSTGESRRTDPF